MKFNEDMGFDDNDWFEVIAKFETTDDYKEMKKLLDEHKKKI